MTLRALGRRSNVSWDFTDRRRLKKARQATFGQEQALYMALTACGLLPAPASYSVPEATDNVAVEWQEEDISQVAYPPGAVSM
jgi:hypothetical protein